MKWSDTIEFENSYEVTDFDGTPLFVAGDRPEDMEKNGSGTVSYNEMDYDNKNIPALQVRITGTGPSLDFPEPSKPDMSTVDPGGDNQENGGQTPEETPGTGDGTETAPPETGDDTETEDPPKASDSDATEKPGTLYSRFRPGMDRAIKGIESSPDSKNPASYSEI